MAKKTAVDGETATEGNGVVKKTRATLASKGLANLQVPVALYEKLSKAGKALDMTGAEFFASHFGGSLGDLLDGNLANLNGERIGGIRDHLTAAVESKVNAVLAEAGV